MKMDLARMMFVLKHLQDGGELRTEGRVWVWLDSHVVKKVGDMEWTIEGLALKGKCYEPGEDVNDLDAGKVHYMGQGDMTLNTFIDLLRGIPQKEIARIQAEVLGRQ
jgi:hypothetical protein